MIALVFLLYNVARLLVTQFHKRVFLILLVLLGAPAGSVADDIDILLLIVPVIAKANSSEVCDSDHLFLCSTETSCISIGGYWYENKCNSTPQETCDHNHLDLCLTEESCISAGGHWSDNTCSKPDDETP